MKKLLFINACIRGKESRTKRIADALLSEMSNRYSIDEIDLTASSLRPLDTEAYNRRQMGICDPLALEYAQRLADADLVVAAFPFWDMSFPAVFKVFCENVTLNGVTFKCSDNGAFLGACKTQRLLLVTTRGMDLEDGDPMEQGSSYLRAIGRLWGIPEIVTVSATGMDMVDDVECERRILAAIEKGKNICKEL